MTKEEEPRIETNWRTADEPSAAWRRLVAKLFASRKKSADSHPERGNTQDAGEEQ